MIRVEQLPLWEVLKSDKVDDAQRGRVKQLIEHAAAILDRVIETFPTYTLHNSTHAVNVVRLMADLLGPRREDLRPLEAAFLLLSAFYHDIGMVFREDERNRLTDEPEWKKFLDTKPDAYLAVKKAGEVPLDIAEWYCRWRHADRVYVYLNRLPDDLLKWGLTSVREELGEVCRSHNLPASDLLELRTDFRGEADLRFCAVLLRLADILDFDRSRSPEAVYDHLGLSRCIDPRQDASDVEWRKHLCSEGFRFPESRPEGYQLGFVAGPDEPGVEHDVREFLQVIKEEMVQCRVLVLSCSEHWRNFILPAGIDLSDIHSNGYRYGEYRFTLDQRQVMDLLMGERLYEEPYVFVRELIQNAIDASRHRRYIERASGNPGFEPMPIQVRHWIDRNGYQWVRFDDFGMGMDEEIVRNYLLKVGSSYYRTASFRAEVLRVRERTQEDFVPISRFGIGLLSCFVVGDRVEISTLRRTDASSPVPIRLSLNGLHGFFTLQTPQLLSFPMPAPGVEEPGYRIEPGTAVAVRLDPTKEKEIFNPRALLEQYVACPPVPVEFEFEHMGGDPARILDQPWCEPTVYQLDQRYIKAVGKLFGGNLQDLTQVEFFPIDLTKHSPTKDLRGQVILGMLQPSQELLKYMGVTKVGSEIKISLFYNRDNRDLRLEVIFNPGLEARELNPQLADGKEATSIALPIRNDLRDTLDLLDQGRLAWLSHNGVALPTQQRELTLRGGDWKWAAGVVCLSDSLRPDLLVSREKLLTLPWKIQSTVELTLYRALSAAGIDLRKSRWSLFGHLRRKPPLLRDLLDDEYIRLDEGWSSLPIIRTMDGFKSLSEVRNSLEDGPVRILIEGGFLGWCSSTLIQLELSASVRFEPLVMGFDFELPTISILKGDPLPITEGHKLFPPLTFLPFEDSARLQSPSSSLINLEHPFTTWLLERAPEIANRYPGLFNRLSYDLLAPTHEPKRSAEFNSILGRLRELHPTVRPPKKLILTEKDFGFITKP